MPQIEQIQPIYWGALRPDPIDFAVDGINVATGPNGSGKTTLLDAIKLSLGIDKLGDRQPEEYIFDGSGDPTARSERALIKVVFANPVRKGKRDRLFADAGRGCEASEYVTAVCEVTRGNRLRYAIHAGYLQWGGEGRSIEEDIAKLRKQIPEKFWMGRQRWSELLSRAGVSRELLGVLALKQGETDKVLAGDPRELLRRMLELTGKQETRERFNEAKTALAGAKATYDQTTQKFEAERRHLQTLELQARQHETFVETKARHEDIEGVELPLARRAELLAERERAVRDRTTLTESLASTRNELQEIRDEIEDLEGDAASFNTRHQELAKQSERAQETLREASEAVGVAGARLRAARVDIGLAGEPLTAEALAQAVQQAERLERAASDLEAERDRLEVEIADLDAGKPPRPPGLDAFRALLNSNNVAAELVAERLEAEQPNVAEAVLGEHVWTLVVPADQFDAACALASENGYRLPIATAGDGVAPTQALRGTSGLPEANAFLAEVDLPLAEMPGVSPDGVVRGRTWSWLRTRAQTVLGAAARERSVAERRKRLSEIDVSMQPLIQRAHAARQEAMRKRTGIDAAVNLSDLEDASATATATAEDASKAAKVITEQLTYFASEASRTNATLAARKEKLETLVSSEANLDRNLRGQETRISELDRKLAELAIPAGHDDLVVQSVAMLEHDLARLVGELADERRFPEEVRSELVLVHRDNQERTVREVETLVEGRRKDLEAVEHEIDRARERYERHIREVVNLLGRRFREVCAQAQMDGEIEIVPSEVEGEFGIDVKVAHVQGEAKRSYRTKAHSTGQKAKISILLLLAAMGLEGSADLLIMDEHSAHLDSRNIDDVAAAMKALSSRVQFVLAIPSNEEAKRIAWADHQLAFYPRKSGERFAPPVVLMTRSPEDERRYVEMGQLNIAE